MINNIVLELTQARDSWVFEHTLKEKFRLRISEEELSSDDTIRVIQAYFLWILLQYDILTTWSMARYYTLQDYKTLLDDLLTYNVSEVIEQLKLFNAFIKDNDLYSLSIRQVKARLKSSGILFATPIFKFINPVMYGLMRERKSFNYDKAILAYQQLNDMSCFITRLTLKDVRTVQEAEIEKYLALESEMGEWKYNPDLTSELREELATLLQGWSLVFDADERPYPRFMHGNGATAELPRGSGIQRKFIVNDFTATREGEYFKLKYCGIPSEQNIDKLISNDELTTSVEFVPKGIDSKRVIGMEPTYNVYHQEGVFHAFDQSFKTKRSDWCIDLHDQSLSRKMALGASFSRKFATIDLSSASDSITLELVSEVFPTEVLAATIPFRTKYGLVGGKYNKRRILLNKFMSMGTPTCFVYMCALFSATCILACKRAGIDPKGNFRVYGDDIIICKEAENILIDILTELHFKVNLKKSFLSDSCFKEACGMEAFRGFNVTPLRISRRYDAIPILLRKEEKEKAKSSKKSKTSKRTKKVKRSDDGNQTWLLNCVELQRQAILRGYNTLSNAIVADTERKKPFMLWVSDPTLFGWLCRVPKNKQFVSLHESSKYGDIIRYNANTQCVEVKTYRLDKSSMEGSGSNDDIKYYYHLSTTSLSSDFTHVTNDFISSCDISALKNVRVKTKWASYYTVSMEAPIRGIPLVPYGN